MAEAERLNVRAGELRWRGAFAADIASLFPAVFLELDVAGLEPPRATREHPTSAPINFELSSSVELLPKTKVWDELGQRLASLPPNGVSIAFLLKQTDHSSMVGEARVSLGDILSSGRDLSEQWLEFKDAQGQLIAEVNMSVTCVRALRAVTASAPLASGGAPAAAESAASAQLGGASSAALASGGARPTAEGASSTQLAGASSPAAAESVRSASGGAQPTAEGAGSTQLAGVGSAALASGGAQPTAEGAGSTQRAGVSSAALASGGAQPAAEGAGSAQLGGASSPAPATVPADPPRLEIDRPIPGSELKAAQLASAGAPPLQPPVPSSDAAPSAPAHSLHAASPSSAPAPAAPRGSADTIAITIGSLSWRGSSPRGVTSVVVDVDVMGLSESLLSTSIRDAGDGLRSVHFDHSAQLSVRKEGKAWQLLAHALRTPERADSDVYFSLRDADPEGGLIAEGFVNLEAELESGKDMADGTPIQLADLSGRVVADLHVGVHALPLMLAVREQVERLGGTVAAAPPPPAGSISVHAGALSFSSSFSQVRVRSVALEMDVMGLREPADRSEAMLRRRRLKFDFASTVELRAGSREWERVASALQTASKADSEVRFVLLDTSSSSWAVLGGATVILEQMLQRGRDKENEQLQLVSSAGVLIAELVVSVCGLDALRLVQASSERSPPPLQPPMPSSDAAPSAPTQSLHAASPNSAPALAAPSQSSQHVQPAPRDDERTLSAAQSSQPQAPHQVEVGHALALQLHRLVLTQAGAASKLRSVLFEADLLGAAEPLPTSKPFLWREDIALDFTARATCAPGTPGLSAIVAALEAEQQRGHPLQIHVTARDASSLAPVGEATISISDLARGGRDREREVCTLLDLNGRALGDLRYSVRAVDVLRVARPLVKEASLSGGAAALPDEHARMPLPTPDDGQRIAALELSERKLAELRESFRKYDRNSSGAITKLEMRRALEAAGVKSSNGEVNAAFTKADGDQDGKISYAEFCELHALGQVDSGARSSAAPTRREQASDAKRALGGAAPPKRDKASDAKRIAALELSEPKLGELRESFRRYDRNSSGAITKLEMRRALDAAGVKPSSGAVDAAFAKADSDSNGKISFAEFCELHALGQADSERASAAPRERKIGSDEQRIAALELPEPKLAELRESFRRYDRNNSGAITKSEMHLAFAESGVRTSGAAAAAAFAKADTDGSGEITFAEFCELHALLPPAPAASSLPKRDAHASNAPRRGLLRSSAAGNSPPRRLGGASDVRGTLDQMEKEKGALRVALTREQAERRQAQAQLTTALERVALLERLVPASAEGAAAARAEGGAGGLPALGSVEARAAALAAELRARAGPAALSAHAARAGSGIAARAPTADAYRKPQADGRRETDHLRMQLELARETAREERGAREEAERRVESANRRAARLQLLAAELEEALISLQADQVELNERQASLETEVLQLAAMADAASLINAPPTLPVSRALGQGQLGGTKQWHGGQGAERPVANVRLGSSYGIRGPSRPATPHSSMVHESPASRGSASSRASAPSAPRADARRKRYGLTAAALRELRAAFARYDSDRSGSISRSELTAALGAAGVAADPHAVASAFSQADANADGQITFAEFCDLHIRQKLAEAAAAAATRAAASEPERAEAARAIQQRVLGRRKVGADPGRPAPSSQSPHRPRLPPQPHSGASASSLRSVGWADGASQTGSLRSSLRAPSAHDGHSPSAGAAPVAPSAQDPAMKGLSPRRELAVRLHNLANEMAIEVEEQDRFRKAAASDASARSRLRY